MPSIAQNAAVTNNGVPARSENPTVVKEFIQAQTSSQKSNETDSQPLSSSDGDTVTLLEEDPFGSEASKILFDGMDDLRRCGVSSAADLDLPQVSPRKHCLRPFLILYSTARYCWTAIRWQVVSAQKSNRHSFSGRRRIVYLVRNPDHLAPICA